MAEIVCNKAKANTKLIALFFLDSWNQGFLVFKSSISKDNNYRYPLDNRCECVGCFVDRKLIQNRAVISQKNRVKMIAIYIDNHGTEFPPGNVHCRMIQQS